MNRWWGTSDDSSKQASDRNSRAARRTINQLQLRLSDDEEFEDCETSINNTSIFNLDGQVDPESEDSRASSPSRPSTPNMPLSAAELAAEKAKPFEDSSYPDDADAWKKEIKHKFDRHDIPYWFNTVESQMKKHGINTQWSKKDAIAEILPEDIIDECKPILRLTETEAGDHIYKDLKTKILRFH